MPGFDGLVVNHDGLREVTDSLLLGVKNIGDRMDQLEKDLSPLQSEWSGQAQNAYHQAKAKWDSAIAEMMQLMRDTSGTVENSGHEYAQADQRGANSFQIG